jgi:hypothetical protein
MRRFRHLRWRRTWARLLRRLSLRPRERRERHAPSDAVALLGAPRLGERSSGASTQRHGTVDRLGGAVRPSRYPACSAAGDTLTLDPRLGERFPYVAVLLAELERRTAPSSTQRRERRRRAAR